MYEVLLVIFQRGLTPDNLGFDIVGGKDDPVLPNDYAVYVNHVVKGSVADGKLKYAVSETLSHVSLTPELSAHKHFTIQGKM